MFNKFLIVIWYILRPKYYQHLFYLIFRKCLFNHETLEKKKKSYEWAMKNAIPYVDALKKLELKGDAVGLDRNLIERGHKLASKSKINMGGSGHIHLLYDCVRLLKANKVVETGVAYGWSSLAILTALSKSKVGKLYSVDMPYPRKNNEKFVGIVIPENLKKNWFLIKKPDRPGILVALKKVGEKIDLCHYDSDKSWWGRHYAYPILWKSLRSGGLFISDDIQDNLYFYEFVKNKSLKFAIVEFNKKYIGIIRKP